MSQAKPLTLFLVWEQAGAGRQEGTQRHANSNTTKQGPEPCSCLMSPAGSTFVSCLVALAHETSRPSAGDSPHINTAARETAGGGPRCF